MEEKMKYLMCIGIVLCLIVTSHSAFAASAKCVVVKKQGNVLIMDCGDQSKGFQEKSKVKIKTDREKN
jgi:hypothetical protein